MGDQSSVHGCICQLQLRLCRHRPSCEHRKGLRDGSACKRPCCSSRSQEFRSQHPTESGPLATAPLWNGNSFRLEGARLFPRLGGRRRPRPPGGARSPRARALSSGPGNARRVRAGAQLPASRGARRAPAGAAHVCSQALAPALCPQVFLLGLPSNSSSPFNWLPSLLHP